MVMQRLAILDEEKRSADKRIEEEYMRRLDNEDKYYLEKRNVLLEAITDIQEGVYGGSSSSSSGNAKNGENENVGEVVERGRVIVLLVAPVMMMSTTMSTTMLRRCQWQKRRPMLPRSIQHDDDKNKTQSDSHSGGK